MKYTLLNTASFRNGLHVPMFQVYDPSTGKVYYKAYVYGRTNRGSITVKSTFEHEHRSEVASWREARAGDTR